MREGVANLLTSHGMTGVETVDAPWVSMSLERILSGIHRLGEVRFLSRSPFFAKTRDLKCWVSIEEWTKNQEGNGWSGSRCPTHTEKKIEKKLDIIDRIWYNITREWERIQLLLRWTCWVYSSQFLFNLKPTKEYRWKLWSEGRWPLEIGSVRFSGHSPLVTNRVLMRCVFD